MVPDDGRAVVGRAAVARHHEHDRDGVARALDRAAKSIIVLLSNNRCQEAGKASFFAATMEPSSQTSRFCRPRPEHVMVRKKYVRPRVIEIGSVAGLTLAGSGGSVSSSTPKGSKPGFRIDGSGCGLVPQGQGNNGKPSCK
jgi:hypothetical protein